MLQLIAIALVAYIAYRFYSGLHKKPLQNTQSRQEKPSRSISTVRCAYCRVHLPAADAIQRGDPTPQYYCCEEHAHKGGA